MQTFKSRRAAQIHMTRAERAYVDAMVASNCAYLTAMQAGHPSPLTYCEEMQARRDEACDKAVAIYRAAIQQGFWVRSWHFGSNPTRDLIAANID